MLEEVQSLCRDTSKLWVQHPTTLAGHPQARRRVPNETKPKPRIPKLWDNTLRCRRICVRGNGRIHSLALLASRIPDDAGRIPDDAGRIPDAVSKLQNFKTPNSEFRISKDAGLELSPTRDEFQNHFRILRRPFTISRQSLGW